jgi:hypothetical protein
VKQLRMIKRIDFSDKNKRRKEMDICRVFQNQGSMLRSQFSAIFANFCGKMAFILKISYDPFFWKKPSSIFYKKRQKNFAKQIGENILFQVFQGFVSERRVQYLVYAPLPLHIYPFWVTPERLHAWIPCLVKICMYAHRR